MFAEQAPFFLQPIFHQDMYSLSSSPRASKGVLLDITYSDPDLKSLVNVAISDWAKEDNLPFFSKRGRLWSDFLALGLPEPKDVQNISLVQNEYLCVRVKAICYASLVCSSLTTHFLITYNKPSRTWSQFWLRASTSISNSKCVLCLSHIMVSTRH